MKRTIMQKSIQATNRKLLLGSMVWVFFWALVVFSLAYPLSSNAQSTSGTEVITGQETSPNYLPPMEDHTRSGKTKVNTGTGTSQGCKSGNFCTSGKQGPGGTYTSTFDIKDNMTIEQINRGFDLDYGMDVDSHVSNSTLVSCVGGNVMQNSDCRDIVNLTVTLFNTGIVVHKFEHELEMDFSGVRGYTFQQTIPSNEFSSLSGQFEMFGIDAGFGNKFFGPAFSNPTLTTTFNLVTFIETEVISIINNTDILDQNLPDNIDTVTDIEVEVQDSTGANIANLELEVNTELSIETQVAQIEAPTMEPPVEVAEINTEIETEMNNDGIAADQPASDSEGGTNTEVVSNEGSEPEAEGEPRTETTEPEVAEVEPEPEAAPKPKVVKKTRAKQKAARKIVKKMGDKGKYDNTNQLKTLIVMQVLGNSKQFFNAQTQLKDTPNFFDNKIIPDKSISDNNYTSYFLFGGSNQLHDALTGSQYK